MRVSRSSLAAVAPGRVTAGGMTAGGMTAPAPRANGRVRHLSAVLIANRGEIAVRVARSVRALGMRAIGIHAADDRPPEGMDLVLAVPGYLDADAILDAARQAGADALHPGYGFLAENPGFAEAAGQAGLAWVGPPPAAIAAMGDKGAARRTAAEHGVPVLPGYDGIDQDDARLETEAERLGYPLLVKPSAGGGGKGMRVVREASALGEALDAARREAARAFGDDRLILERLLDRPRHVEVQVLFDEQGSGVHLGERDCSAQRRNQKIVEESPGPSVDAGLRARLGTAALTVAAAAGYVGAGTVEFLLGKDGRFWFLEMNTRLQVEHPVTEALTGRDLVADQLRIAGGEPLGFGQEQVSLSGHAVEARLYAEDPESGFLPATGRIVQLRWPEGVRVDTGLREGDDVTDRYDPLLAKLIAHAPTRDEALARLRAALGQTRVLGVRTNLRFLRWLLDHPAMRDGEVRTDTIDSLRLPDPPLADDGTWHAAAGASAELLPTDVWGDGWRANASRIVRLRHADEERSMPIGAEATTDGVAVDRPSATIHVDVEGQSLDFAIAAPPTVDEAVRHAAAHTGGHAALTAPMPGRVIGVRTTVGASVPAHATVLVIEAMKMEHAVVTPLAGTVTHLHVREGQQVRRGDLLAEVSVEGEP
jgi:acetyl/propionyl-CoA carboxylase alpha subunit